MIPDHSFLAGPDPNPFSFHLSDFLSLESWLLLLQKGNVLVMKQGYSGGANKTLGAYLLSQKLFIES